MLGVPSSPTENEENVVTKSDLTPSWLSFGGGGATWPLVPAAGMKSFWDLEFSPRRQHFLSFLHPISGQLSHGNGYRTINFHRHFKLPLSTLGPPTSYTRLVNGVFGLQSTLNSAYVDTQFELLSTANLLYSRQPIFPR